MKLSHVNAAAKYRLTAKGELSRRGEGGWLFQSVEGVKRSLEAT